MAIKNKLLIWKLEALLCLIQAKAFLASLLHPNCCLLPSLRTLKILRKDLLSFIWDVKLERQNKEANSNQKRMWISGRGPTARAGAQEAIVVKLLGKKITSKESGHPEENKTKEITIEMKRHSNQNKFILIKKIILSLLNNKYRTF